jgi:hypothetical protein
MLKSNFPEGQTNLLEVGDVEPVVLELMLSFLHQKEFELRNIKIGMDVYKAARMYLIEDLKVI